VTRTHTSSPVWTWKCDECGYEAWLERNQGDLPTPNEMREHGWFIAEKFGDLCPMCNAIKGENK